MKKKFVCRIAAALVSAVIGVGAVCAFTACTSDHPEVTITYEFEGESYAVKYTLSRADAPETVKHFIELADAGYYDGTVIHNYNSSFLYGGGYTIDENKRLVEKDYFAEVKKYEEEHSGFKFTQSVYKTDKVTPLYTVVGEFAANLRGPMSREYRHTQGALVMYYYDFETYNVSFTGEGRNVYVERADGGKENDGEKSDTKLYRYNSATSLFYTFVSSDSRTDLETNYAVFGKVKNFEKEMRPLLDAIAEFKDSLGEEESFTTSYTEVSPRLPLYSKVQGDDPDYEALRRVDALADFDAPLENPITVTSVKVNKY